MKYLACYTWIFLLSLSLGCSGEQGGPAAVTPEQEKIILEKMKESQEMEGKSFQEKSNGQ